MMEKTSSWLTVAALLLGASAAAGDPFACPADVDGSGSVDVMDLNYLLAAWGTSDALADFDGDGDVACFDLELLLGWWGGCPSPPGDVTGDGEVDLEDLALVEANLGLDCAADVNGDGAVDGDDVDAFLCLWGGPGPLGDLDGDGVVGVQDLNALLGAFGAECRCDLDGDGLVAISDVEILDKRIGK